MKKIKGFTLIELMVTVAIVGIIASIAVPGYRDYVLRSQITEATSNLSGLRVKMEQFYQENRTYTGACTNGTLAPIPTGLKYFAITCSNLGSDTYTLTATGTNGFTFAVDETNSRSTTAVPSGWSSNATCWILNKQGLCQ